MLIRSTVFFLLFSAVLAAQPSGWQSYLHANYLVGGVETPGYLWLAAANSIAKIEQRTGTAEVVYYQNSSLPRTIRGIEALDTDEFVVLGDENKLVYWRAGNWSEQFLQVPNNDYLQRIIGHTDNQELLLAGQRKLYQLTSAGEVVHLQYAEQALQNDYFRDAALDREKRMWITGQLRILQLDADGTVLLNRELEGEYNIDMKVEDGDNVWVTTNKNIYLWIDELQRFEQLPVEDLGLGQSGGVISAVFDRKAIISLFNRVFQVSYTDGTFQVEEFSSSFPITQTPGSYGFQDDEGQLWYIDQQRKLVVWRAGTAQSPEVFTKNPWLPLSEITSLGLDPQGKVWLGGSFKTAYQIGGHWKTIPLDPIGFFPIGVNDIAFKSDGTPVVGSGSLFVFGFPDSQVREWNGTTWDTLASAVTGPSFLPVTDVKMDPDDNLWVLRSFDNLFSVKNLGNWYRFRTIDMPIEVNAFTCFEQDLDGSMWIGTNNGLIRYDGFAYSVITAENLHAANQIVSSIAVDKNGDKWVALGRGGLRREVNGEWLAIDEIADMAQQYGLDKVVCGAYPEVWASLGWNGVLHYDGNSWEHLTPENSGLIDARVNDILHDHQGRTWFANSLSVSVYSPEQPAIKPYQRPPDQAVGIYPNPGCCQYEVNWLAAQPGTYELQLYNASGQLMQHWPVVAKQLGEQYFNFDQGDLAAGTYFLSVNFANQQIGTQSLVVLQ